MKIRILHIFVLIFLHFSILSAQDITKILPSPPDERNINFVSDYLEYKWGKTVRDETTGRLAYNFIMWDSQSFLHSLSKGLDINLSAKDTPKICQLLEYATEAAEKVITSAQNATDRERPYVMFGESSYVKSNENKYKNVGSYPCDQAVKGWLYSLLLAEISPKNEEKIYERGLKYGPAMTISGYSFESDVEAGHLLACALLVRLHGESEFKTLLKDAKAEYQSKAGTRDAEEFDEASGAFTRASDEPYKSTASLPNSAKYLPEPPEELSCQQMIDLIAYNNGKLLRTQEAGEQAIEDVEYSADRFCTIFSEVLGQEISASKTPAIYELLNRVHPSGNAATQSAKAEYQRPRPYVYMDEPTSYPADESDLRNTGSYPSGHASGSWLMAMVLSEVTQTKQDELLARAYQFGQGRVITGYHWQSDVKAGRLVGSTVYACLHNESAFNDQMDKAIKEYQKVYGGTTGIRGISVSDGSASDGSSDGAALYNSAPIYSLDGVLMNSSPTQPGIYIQGNNKIVKK